MQRRRKRGMPSVGIFGVTASTVTAGGAMRQALTTKKFGKLGHVPRDVPIFPTVLANEPWPEMSGRQPSPELERRASRPNQKNRPARVHPCAGRGTVRRPCPTVVRCWLFVIGYSEDPYRLFANKQQRITNNHSEVDFRRAESGQVWLGEGNDIPPHVRGRRLALRARTHESDERK